MHDINYFHDHELKEHDFPGCCRDCRHSLDIIKPHILAFAERIQAYSREMLQKLPPDELYRLYQLLDDLAHLEVGAHLAGLILAEDEIKAVSPVIRGLCLNGLCIIPTMSSWPVWNPGARRSGRGTGSFSWAADPSL